MSGKGSKAADAPDERLVAQHKSLEKKNAAVRYTHHPVLSLQSSIVIFFVIKLQQQGPWRSTHQEGSKECSS